MKLRNKKTGEVVDLLEIVRLDNLSNEFYLRLSDNEGRTFKVGFNSLSELNAEWEDYEEPKEYWYIESDGSIIQNHKPTYINYLLDGLKVIGNYFETKEEAEQAVKKLKAWKRLQDAGVTFHVKVIDYKWYLMPKVNTESVTFKEAHEIYKDIDLVFGVKDNEGNN